MPVHDDPADTPPTRPSPSPPDGAAQDLREALARVAEALSSLVGDDRLAQEYGRLMVLAETVVGSGQAGEPAEEVRAAGMRLLLEDRRRLAHVVSEQERLLDAARAALAGMSREESARFREETSRARRHAAELEARLEQCTDALAQIVDLVSLFRGSLQFRVGRQVVALAAAVLRREEGATALDRLEQVAWDSLERCRR